MGKEKLVEKYLNVLLGFCFIFGSSALLTSSMVKKEDYMLHQ
jgi:hypothetical protein